MREFNEYYPHLISQLNGNNLLFEFSNRTLGLIFDFMVIVSHSIQRYRFNILKLQCHETLDLLFYFWTKTLPGLIKNKLKGFRDFFSISRRYSLYWRLCVVIDYATYEFRTLLSIIFAKNE